MKTENNNNNKIPFDQMLAAQILNLGKASREAVHTLRDAVETKYPEQYESGKAAVSTNIANTSTYVKEVVDKLKAQGKPFSISDYVKEAMEKSRIDAITPQPEPLDEKPANLGDIINVIMAKFGQDIDPAEVARSKARLDGLHDDASRIECDCETCPARFVCESENNTFHKKTDYKNASDMIEPMSGRKAEIPNLSGDHQFYGGLHDILEQARNAVLYNTYHKHHQPESIDDLMERLAVVYAESDNDLFDANTEAYDILVDQTKGYLTTLFLDDTSDQELYDDMSENAACVLMDRLLEGRYTPAQYIQVVNHLNVMLDDIFEL